MSATRAFGLVAVALSAAIGGCRQTQDSLLYYPTSAPATPPSAPPGWTVESLALTRPDNVELRGWFVKPATIAAPLLIYFGGNAEEISAQIPTVNRLGGRAVALVNYRGYGRSTGRPSEAALTSDALAIFDAM